MVLVRELHERASELFLTVCDFPNSEQIAELQRLCNDDPRLFQAVTSLLTFDPGPDDDSSAGSREIPTHHGSDNELKAGVDSSGDSDDRPMIQRIGPFTIRKKIGEGASSMVYLAEQDDPRRDVALKVMRAGFWSEQSLTRFRHEARILGRLRHPGIVAVFDAQTSGQEGESPYFAMELADGLVLHEYLRHHEPEIRERIELIIQVCEAVQHAHENAVVHRDLKPNNIMVQGDGRPRVLDFGVARVLDDDEPRTQTQTLAGQLVGTIPYMSPEQLSEDPAAVDSRTDIYALGVICYESLARRLPFDLDKKSIIEAIRIITETAPRPLREVDRRFRGGIDAVVMKAIAKNKSERYESAGALAADLRRYLDGFPPVARHPGVFQHASALLRRQYRRVAVGVVVALIILAAGVHRGRIQRANNLVTEALLLQSDAGKIDNLLLASAKYEEALSVSPRNVRVLANYAALKKDIYNSMRKPDDTLLVQGLELCDRALEEKPGIAGIWNNKGVILKKLSRYPEARDAYRQALGLAPEVAATWANLGAVSAILNNLVEARDCLETAVEVGRETFSGGWRDLATMQLFDGDPGSKQSIDFAIEKDRTDAWSYLVRGRILLQQPDGHTVEAAHQDLQVARRLFTNPEPRIIRLLALSHLALGDVGNDPADYEEALVNARTAVELGGMLCINHLIASIAEAQLGQQDKAYQSLVEADETWPPDLVNEGDYRFTSDRGFFWFETADELLALRDRASSLLEAGAER
ncbi:MAG: protein kinase domain-containing protein [Planctomycetota bacterium]|jgi:tetratricopeptide (TPR) repeat protein/tRNA A-37 threonylcarbamoyl transferase component Bud32